VLALGVLDVGQVCPEGPRRLGRLRRLDEQPGGLVVDVASSMSRAPSATATTLNELSRAVRWRIVSATFETL
jgi:hypothetical protein